MRAPGRFWPRREPVSAIILVAILVFASLLALSLIRRENRWEMSYAWGGGVHATRVPQTSSVYVADNDVLRRYERSGDNLVFDGGAYFSPPWDWLRPLFYHRGWLLVGDEGALFAFSAAKFPSDGTLHNFTTLDHRGPVTLYYAVSPPPPVDWEAVGFAEYGDTLLVAVHLGDTSRIVALDLPDPGMITEDPASLHQLYNMTFDGWIYTMNVQGSLLYALEGNGTDQRFHVIDLSTTPPTERLAFSLRDVRLMDALGSDVAVVTNRTFSMYEIDGTSFRRVSSVSLPGDPEWVGLLKDEAYVTWDVGTGWAPEVGMTVFDTHNPASPSELWRVELPVLRWSWGVEFALGDGAVYFPGNGEVAMAFLASRPAILTNGALDVGMDLSLGVAVSGALYSFFRRRESARLAWKKRLTDFPPK